MSLGLPLRGTPGTVFSVWTALVFLTGLGGEVVGAMDCPHHRASSAPSGAHGPGAGIVPGGLDQAAPIHHEPGAPRHDSHEPTHDHEGPCTCMGPCTVATGITPPAPATAGPVADDLGARTFGPAPEFRVTVDPGLLPFMHPYSIPPPSRVI
jgi:hypothetical protein